MRYLYMMMSIAPGKIDG